MKTLSGPQKMLLDKINLYKYVGNYTGIFKYDDMKKLCEFKSFDSTFNALLSKGYLKHFATNDFSNKFILSINK
jgi:hypothetical protein